MKIKYTCRISAAHRLINYIGKCAQIHGHEYTIIFEFERKELFNDMVIDFNQLRFIIDSWVEKTFDHKILLNEKDPLCKKLTKKDGLVTMPFNPTAERLAEILAKETVKKN